MHTGSNRLAFFNLPVTSVAASRAFFSALGFSFDDRFSDDTTACLQLSETACVMLLEHERFAAFTVDDFADTALARGATPAKEPLDTAGCTAAASWTSTATTGRSCG